MLYLLPVLAAIAFASLTIFEKVILKKRKITIKTFTSASFLAAIIVMLPLLYFFWRVDSPALHPMNILIFASVVIISLVANLFLFFAIRWEKIEHIEPALIMEPLFTVLLAIIFSFFTVGLYDRNMNIIFPAIIAGLALILSHIKKHHLDFNKYFLAAIAGAFFFALELVVSRLILHHYTPITFYFLRCTGVFLLAVILFKPEFSKIKTKTRWQILVLGLGWVIYRVIVYYGYLTLGVIFTTLIVMLGPVFVYLFAKMFLKEKIEKRNVIAAAVIVACILYAMLA